MYATADLDYRADQIDHDAFERDVEDTAPAYVTGTVPSKLDEPEPEFAPGTVVVAHCESPIGGFYRTGFADLRGAIRFVEAWEDRDHIKQYGGRASVLNAVSVPVGIPDIKDAVKDLEKLVRKAQRYGNPDIQFHVGAPRQETYKVTNWDGSTSVHRRQVRDIHVHGEAPRIGDHEFIARVEPTDAGNVLQIVPGVDDVDQRFRTSGVVCEHCRTQRDRKDLYIVRERSTRAQLQVGRTCLRDYLGTDFPSKIAHRFGFWKEFDTRFRSGPGQRQEWAHGTLSLLALSNAAVRLWGWCSKGESQRMWDTRNVQVTPTAAYVALGMRDLSDLDPKVLDQTTDWKKLRGAVCEDDFKFAADVVAWGRALTGTSDYESNLRTILSGETVSDRRHVGIAVSAVAGYARHLEQELRRTIARNTLSDEYYPAEVGARVDFIAKVTHAHPRQSDFGPQVILTLVTKDGIRVKTFATGAAALKLKVGDVRATRATIKRKDLGRDERPETIVSRAAFSEVTQEQLF